MQDLLLLRNAKYSICRSITGLCKFGGQLNATHGDDGLALPVGMDEAIWYEALPTPAV